MVLVYYWVPPYLYEELFTMSCIGYVAQTTDGYEERVTYSNTSSQGYTEENQKYWYRWSYEILGQVICWI
jgi:hypothetical protein